MHYRPEKFPHIEVKSRINARARRLTLRRDNRDGRFVLSHPKRASKREIQKFINDHADWLEAHYEPLQHVEIGSMLLFRGERLTILEGEKRGVHLEGGDLQVKSVHIGRAVAAYLKTQAQLYAPARVEYYCDQLDCSVEALRWRDPKSRWGSCDSNGTIMLSWRLIMAPDFVFDYVIAHEVAHRIEMNHSSRFWALVEKVYPDHKKARAWLRKEGRTLQSVMFSL